MTDETNIAENDTLSPRDRETMDSIKKKFGEYVEYEDIFALARAGHGLKVDEGITELLQSFISDLKIRSFAVDIDVFNAYQFCGNLWVMLRERDDWTVVSFNVTPA